MALIHGPEKYPKMAQKRTKMTKKAQFMKKMKFYLQQLTKTTDLDLLYSFIAELIQYRLSRGCTGSKNRPKWQKLSFFMMFWKFFKVICFGNLLFAHIWYIFDVRSTFE